MTAEELARGFDQACRKAAGRHAAPRSWLPATSTRVATALDVVYLRLLEGGGQGSVWPAIRSMREAIVDLQAFLPDEDAAAAEARRLTADDTGARTPGTRWSRSAGRKRS